MRKAFLDHLRLLDSMTPLSNLRDHLNRVILENQAVAVTTKDHMQRCISVRRIVLAELTLRVLKQARSNLDFAMYVEAITRKQFSYSLDLLREIWIKRPIGFRANPVGPWWIWMATRFLAIESIRFSEPATLEVSVLLNLRYKRLCETIFGYPKSTAPYYYGITVRRPLIRFVDIRYTGSCFPSGGLPKGRLVDAEVSPLVFQQSR